LIFQHTAEEYRFNFITTPSCYSEPTTPFKYTIKGKSTKEEDILRGDGCCSEDADTISRNELVKK